MRGKLVPQDLDDQPADALLAKIALERGSLISEKRERQLSEIRADEKPFPAPRGWEWSRLQDVAAYIQRGKGPQYADHGQVRVVSQKCVQWAGFDLTPARYVDDASLYGYQPERFLRKGDLLWNSTGTGTVGRINVVPVLEANSVVADSHVTVIRPLIMSSGFLRCYMAAPAIQDRIDPGHDRSLVSGTTNQVELNLSAVTQLVVPVPPLAEQHRIVAKVDELMILCDQLEQQQADSIGAHRVVVETLLATLARAASPQELAEAWIRIATHFDILLTTEESIDQVKRIILQLAVMGKLATQDPNDEPASVLLERIAREKARLAGDGGNNSHRAFPVKGGIEGPYGLPAGWTWTRLGNIGLASTGKTPSTGKREYYGGDVPFTGPGQITLGGEILDSDKSLTNEGCEQGAIAEPGDILMVCIGGSIGKSAIATSRIAFNQQINSIRPILVSPEMINYAMNTAQFQAAVMEKATGSATPIINRSKWEDLLVPLPPKPEQDRIVIKVDELMALCDTLQANIADANATQVQLADAIVVQAVA